MMNKYQEALNNIKKEAGTPYFSSLYDIDDWKEDFKTLQELVDKEREYKALEEELGISLPILFKVLKNGIYYKSVNSGIHYISGTCLELEYSFGAFELWVDGHKTFDGLLIHLKDYKKRWALCEEDLKSE